MNGMFFFYLWFGLWIYNHIRFWKNYWTAQKATTGQIYNREIKTVFSKYGDEKDPKIGHTTYFIKGVQFMVFFLCTLAGFHIADSATIAFVGYNVLMFMQFKKKELYHWLNGALCLGMLIERTIHFFNLPPLLSL